MLDYCVRDEKKISLPLISIIVCTFNRFNSLQDLLACFLKQRLAANFNFEIIIVDNNSTDKTKEVIEGYFDRFKGKLRYIFEKRQGLCFARNAGLAEAKGEIIAFTDDDCLPNESWLMEIAFHFQNEKIDGLLGTAFNMDGSCFYPKNSGILRGNGLNMSFKKDFIKQVGGFDVLLGAGSIGSSADDVEFIYRANKISKDIILCDDVIVVHKHRAGKKEEVKFAYRDSKGYIIFWLKHLLLYKDIFALKSLCHFFLWIWPEIFKQMTGGDKHKISLRLAQLKGMIFGFLLGFYIWLILFPLNRKKFSCHAKNKRCYPNL